MLAELGALFQHHEHDVERGVLDEANGMAVRGLPFLAASRMREISSAIVTVIIIPAVGRSACLLCSLAI